MSGTKNRKALEMTTELESLQGEWHVIALKSDGQRIALTLPGDARIVIKRNRFISLGMGAVYEGVVRLIVAAKPKGIDLEFTAGHAKGIIQRGIYKLAQDKLTICLAPVGHTRPSKMASIPGTGNILQTLTRDTSRKASGEVQKSKDQPGRAWPAKARKLELCLRASGQ